MCSNQLHMTVHMKPAKQTITSPCTVCTYTVVENSSTSGSESLLALAMAASLQKSKQPSLVSKLEGHTDTINQALPIPGEDAVISVADDK